MQRKALKGQLFCWNNTPFLLSEKTMSSTVFDPTGFGGTAARRPLKLRFCLSPFVNPEDTAPYTEEDTGYREFKLKLSKIKDRMLTTEGRRMAEERHAFMEAFFERFLKEHEGIQ